MTDNLRPTRAEAIDVANAVLDGSDAILLGAETLRGLYPIEIISTVGKICAEVQDIFSEAAATAAPCLLFFISASIAQVHQAGLRGDKIDVVVKVQHPGIQDLYDDRHP